MNVTQIKALISKTKKELTHFQNLNYRFSCLKSDLSALKNEVFPNSFELPTPLIDLREIINEKNNKIKELELLLKDKLNEKLSKTDNLKLSYFYRSPQTSFGSYKVTLIGFNHDKTLALVFIKGHSGYVNRLEGVHYVPAEIKILSNINYHESLSGNYLKGVTYTGHPIAEQEKLTVSTLTRHTGKIRKYIPEFEPIVPPKGFCIDYVIYQEHKKNNNL